MIIVQDIYKGYSMTQPWRGIFVIVVTPFTENYELDEASLRKEIRFCIEAGAHGLVGPTMNGSGGSKSSYPRRAVKFP
jgi:dihydrodipicolinate synthase/N-acetylneuraminate lyase